MTIRHVVMFRFTDDTTQDQVMELMQGAIRTATAIEGVRAYRCGPDLGRSSDNYDLVAIADFDHFEDFESFRDHPDHVAFVNEVIKPKLEHRAAVQYEVHPGSPGVS